MYGNPKNVKLTIMKKIADWYLRYKPAFYVLFFSGHLCLLLLAYFLSEEFLKIKYQVSLNRVFEGLIAGGIMYAVLFFYGHRQQGLLKKIKPQIKFLLGFLSCLASFSIAVIYFSGDKNLTFFSSAKASIILLDSSLYKYERSSTILESISSQDIKVLTGSERRVLKKELKHQIKKYSRHKRANDKEKSGTTFRIIMIIFLALVLLLVLAGVAYVAAYGGTLGLAIGIFIGGLAGIIFLTIFLIKKVNKRNRGQSALAVNVN
jgi:hypothetical protein